MKSLLLLSLAVALVAAPQRAGAKSKSKRVLLASGIAFEARSATIHKSSLPALDAAAATMKKNKKMTVRIEVHTDSSGSSSYNRRISQQRADAIASYLVKRGINAKRLDPRGYGEDHPIADNKTAAGRAANRRAEIVVVAP